jgi:hypothetical protein
MIWTPLTLDICAPAYPAADALLQNSPLAAERLGNYVRDGSDACGAPHGLMHDQPHHASCRRFVGPNADQIRRGIAEKACSFGNAPFARRGSKLDERVVAAKRYPRTFERLAHEKGLVAVGAPVKVIRSKSANPWPCFGTPFAR